MIANWHLDYPITAILFMLVFALILLWPTGRKEQGS